MREGEQNQRKDMTFSAPDRDARHGKPDKDPRALPLSNNAPDESIPESRKGQQVVDMWLTGGRCVML